MEVGESLAGPAEDKIVLTGHVPFTKRELTKIQDLPPLPTQPYPPLIIICSLERMRRKYLSPQTPRIPITYMVYPALHTGIQFGKRDFTLVIPGDILF